MNNKLFQVFLYKSLFWDLGVLFSEKRNFKLKKKQQKKNLNKKKFKIESKLSSPIKNKDNIKLKKKKKKINKFSIK